MSGCDGGSSPSIRTLNEILVRQSDPLISSSSFEEIEKEASQEQAAAAKRAWMEEEQSIYEDILTRIQATEALRQDAEAVTDDPMRKQEMVVRCRLELKALQHAAVNVKDVSKKLDIVVSFLSNISGQLSEMDKKLDMIQQDIASIRSDLKRLVGRPPLDVISDWRRKYLSEISGELQREVYVEAEVCRAGPKGDFKKDAEFNKSLLVSVAFKEFMENDKEDEKKDLLLLSGLAGSGKSTAVEKMKKYVLEEYSASRREKDDVTVLFLPVSLPTLRDPLSGVFEEGMKLAFEGALSVDQVHELGDEIRKECSKIEVVFFLDAYDELRPEFLQKNLWLSNNLDRYRCPNPKCRGPKVLITSRSELFAGQESKNYLKFFCPIVKAGTNKRDEAMAMSFLDEFRFVGFDDKISAYQRQHVAMTWRDAFLLRFRDRCTKKYVARRINDTVNDTETMKTTILPALSFSPTEVDQLCDVYTFCTVEEHDNSSSIAPANNVRSFEDGVWLKDNIQSAFGTLKKLSGISSANENISCGIVALFVSLFDINHEDTSLMATIAEFIKSSIQSESLLWTIQQYNDEFKKTPELKELSTTPFMVEVVTKILPILQSERRSTSEIKSSLVLMYGETIAEELWTELNSGSVIVDFSNVQKKLATTESNKETDENLKIIEERDEVLKIIKDIAQSVGKGYYKKKDD